MNTIARTIDYKGETCIELISGDYRALIAPFNGSNVMKLENTALDIDVFRNDPELTPAQLKAAAEIYGMPTLYLPNRLSHGNLKTSSSWQPSPWFPSSEKPRCQRSDRRRQQRYRKDILYI